MFYFGQLLTYSSADMTHFYHPIKCATRHLYVLDKLFSEIVPEISQNVLLAESVTANNSVAANSG